MWMKYVVLFSIFSGPGPQSGIYIFLSVLCYFKLSHLYEVDKNQGKVSWFEVLLNVRFTVSHVKDIICSKTWLIRI
jgi:hypothetical protein